MYKFITNNLKSISVLMLGFLAYNTTPPSNLSLQAWHLSVIFLFTIVAIIVNVSEMGALVMIALLLSLLTKTLTISQALFGFGSSVVWLVVFAFFISRGIINSNLGKRAAYYFISKFGHNVVGLSYGLIFTELFLAPFIPSASARGGGIVYPIAKALSEEYQDAEPSDATQPAGSLQYLMFLCSQANIVTSGMFLTAMAGNPLIAILAAGIGVNISIVLWAKAMIVPGLTILALLPFVIRFIIKPKIANMAEAQKAAVVALKDMGKMSRKEKTVLGTFAILIVLWIGSERLGVDATTTSLLGLIILFTTNVLSWNDVVSEKEAWRTFIWFAGFITLSKFLSDFGVTEWVGQNITEGISSFNPAIAIPLIVVIFFYMHYFFASITVYASVMYVTFTMLLISMGVPSTGAALMLAFLANISACLTHYGISSAPIFVTGSTMKIGRWLQYGLLTSFFYLAIFVTVGLAWFKILNIL